MKNSTNKLNPPPNIQKLTLINENEKNIRDHLERRHERNWVGF